MQFLRLALLSSVVFATSFADARPYVPLDDEDPPPTTDQSGTPPTKVAITPAKPVDTGWPFRLEAGIGVRWGSFLVNNVDAKDSVKQFHLDGGFRFHDHRMFLYGQYALQSMQIPLDELAARSGTPVAIGNGRGLMHRLAAHGRYSFARAGEHDGGLDLFADAGVGVQHIRWDAGGAWTRPDLQLSLGIAGFGVGDRQHGGMSISMVLTLAPRNDVEGAGRACGGPCDYATEPTGIDRSFMFDVTLMFGK
jgi:hypothetical protein